MTLKNRGSQRKRRGGQGQTTGAVVWQRVPTFKEAVTPPPPPSGGRQATLGRREGELKHHGGAWGARGNEKHSTTNIGSACTYYMDNKS